MVSEEEDSGNDFPTEEEIEQMLSEKLMAGYTLLESCCPVCTTPLIKNAVGGDHDNRAAPIKQPVLLSSDSFEKPFIFKPVDGVPVCIVCQAHVITSESDISILERCESLKDKGSILIALNESSSHVDGSKYTNEEEDNMVVISVESVEKDGEENIFEVSSTPKSGDPRAPIFVDEDDEEQIHQEKSDVSDVMTEYSVRREIATKVLGAKMLQGYTLKETTCDRCGMPLMEHKKKITCVVCPALAKKAKKKLKEEQRLQHEIDENRKLEMHLQYEQLEKDRREKEERLNKFREEELERERFAKKQKEIEAERLKLLAMEKEEEENLLALEREEARLLQEARDHAARLEAERLQSIAEHKQDEQRLEALKLETNAMLAAQHVAETAREREEAEALLEETRRLETVISQEGDKEFLARQSALADRLVKEKAKQKEEEAKILEETRILEALETQTLATRSEYMKRDLLEQEHRRRLVGKARLDEEITRLEEARRNEEQEVRRLAEERRAEEEARMIAYLEADAAAKALAAEEAIRKAKEALKAVSSTKRDLIAQTIALAEKEAIAETEKEIMKEREDHKEKVVLPTESELYKERWETLRMEGRAIMTRRVLQGWQLLPSACKGKECEASPLITKNGRTECAVCGGSGNGEDGVYAAEDFDDFPVDITTIDPELMPYDVNMKLSRSFGDEVRSLGNDEDFDKKRDMVSKEIGRRMLLGWTLMDASCPDCVMPLMMDNLGNTDICVLCGPLNPAFDASTIKSREMASLDDEVEEERTEDGSQKNRLAAKTDETVASVDISTAKGDDLLVAIRERASRERIAAVSPKAKQGDPPAFTKGISTTMYENALADSEDSDEEKKDDDEHVERAITADEIIKKSDSNKDAMSTEAIAKMFLRSPHGDDFHDIGADMTLEEVKELVDIFMATNFNETVPDDFKYEVAREILDKSRPEVDYVVEPAVIFDREPPTTPTSGGIINLENMPSPTNRNFYFNDYVEESTIKSSKSAKRREKPTPETMMASAPSKSPRPPRAGGSGRRDGAPIIVGGPFSNGATSRRHQHHDNRSTGGMSRAESVASDALDSIYVRIEECKKKLMDPKNSIQDQLATADLMEKLAKAAVAMKAMETIEQNE